MQLQSVARQDVCGTRFRTCSVENILPLGRTFSVFGIMY